MFANEEKRIAKGLEGSTLYAIMYLWLGVTDLFIKM